MAIISQETWDNMPKEEKEKIIEYYSSMSCGESHQHAVEILIGKENLQPKTPKNMETTIEKYSTEEQDKRWDALSEQEKDDNIDAYHKMRNYGANMCEIIASDCMRKLYGEHNLVSKIKTWSDIVLKYRNKESAIPDIRTEINIFASPTLFCDKLIRKASATLKIAKLIELGYGGMVTYEEWKKSSSYETEDAIWTIECEYKKNYEGPQFRVACGWEQVSFPAFHSYKQAEEFMSYPDNVELVKQYNML